jgi:hypothetical protein
MKNLKIVWVLLLGATLFSFYRPEKFMRYFVIEQGTEIKIYGASNVADFSCCCESSFDPQFCTFYADDDNGTFRFENAQLDVNSQEINCGGKAINRDMQQTLKADKYPFIRVILEEVTFPQNTTNLKKGHTLQVDALAQIIIAGNAQSNLLQVEVKDLGNQRYIFASNAFLKLSDFGLETPKPLLGLIKVDDRITIDFKLIVQLKDNPDT